MVKRNAHSDNNEPGQEQKGFNLPSQKEHLFQCVDVINDFNDDPNIFFAKCEVVGGEEEGRTLLIRLSLDDSFKGFFATRLFLKAICEPYKGQEFPIDTDNWPGRQFYATVIHNKISDKIYANIKEYNFDKKVEQFDAPKEIKKDTEVIW